jgi:serine/threonine protein kinase
MDVPACIGRYRVERKLGEGGMATVYLAHDPQLDRPVALKVPRGEAASARFLREARAAATLRHPNICPIYDLGEADGIRYLCLAYVHGEPLSRKAGRGRPLPVVEAVTIVRTVARAMHEAHRLGVIHRDLKPANVMIDDAGQPVVMDFGLARPCTPLATQLTAGDVMGTPAYMPPEQIEGDVLRMGLACDIYSLGVILYELLTGTVPFHGDLIALATQIVADAPAPPSRHRPDLDLSLAVICLKALAKDPDDRWPTMAAFADALDHVLRDESAAPAAVLTLRIAGTPYAYRADPRQDVVTVGRQKRHPDSPPGEGNDVVLRVTGDDELSLRISRRHLEIHRTPTSYTVTDHSRAGTALNGRPLPPGAAVPLDHGDRLGIAGMLTLKVLLDEPRAAGTIAHVDLPAAGGPGRIVLEATQGDMVTLEPNPKSTDGPPARERALGDEPTRL